MKEFKSSSEWREWLEKNHGEKEAWVVISKKRTKEGLKYGEALEEAICYGWIDGKMKSLDAGHFLLRFSPRRKKSVWSKINKGTAERMAAEGKMTEYGRQTVDWAQETGNWSAAYSSRSRPELPEDLKKALKADRGAWKNFSAFPNSAQFQYVYWVNAAKREETRENRIAEVVRRAADNRKPG